MSGFVTRGGFLVRVGRIAACAIAVMCAAAFIGCAETESEMTEVDREGRQAELARLRHLIASGGGDVELGREIFASRCGNCHQLHDAGSGSMGPDLTPYQRDEESVPFLLQAVSAPSAEIHPYHSMFEIRTLNDEVITGVMSDRDEETVTLFTSDGERVILPREQIAAETPVYASSMPDHLLQAMTDQQVVDLFAFLLSDEPAAD